MGQAFLRKQADWILKIKRKRCGIDYAATLNHAPWMLGTILLALAVGMVRAHQIRRESRPSEHEPSEATGTTRYRFHLVIQPFRGFLQLTQRLPWIRDDRKFRLPEMRQP